MSSQQSFANISCNEQEDQEQAYRSRFKRQASDHLNSLNYSIFSNRVLLSSSYRKLNSLLQQVENDKFNLNHDDDMINQIVDSAYFYRPYQMRDQQYKFRSTICGEATSGHRKCKEPLIKIDQQIINFQQGKFQKLIVREKPFLLTIESEPNSFIIYSNKPRTHPLLIFDEAELQRHNYFKKRAFEKCSQMITPPCDLSIVVVKDPFKIQSKLIKLNIISNQNEETKNKIFGLGWAIRAQETFNYQDSASGNAISYSMNEESF